jgi:hypothetical protein
MCGIIGILIARPRGEAAALARRRRAPGHGGSDDRGLERAPEGIRQILLAGRTTWSRVWALYVPGWRASLNLEVEARRAGIVGA